MQRYDLYGGTPPHENVDTSREAAEQIAPVARSLRDVVYGTLKVCGHVGATDDQLEILTGLKHQTVSARRRELVLQGWVTYVGWKRETRSGRLARVWVAEEERRPPLPRSKVYTDRERLEFILSEGMVYGHRGVIKTRRGIDGIMELNIKDPRLC